MSPASNQPGPRIISRVVGAAIGGGGSYALLTLTGAWGLGGGVVLGIAAGMAVAGFLAGPRIVGVVLELA